MNMIDLRDYSRHHDRSPTNGPAIPQGPPFLHEGYPVERGGVCRYHYGWVWIDVYCWVIVLVCRVTNRLSIGLGSEVLYDFDLCLFSS